MNVSRSSASHKNKVELAGVLAANPVIRATGNGKKVANFTLATSTEKNGTEYHRVVAWQELADQVERLHEGGFIQLLGRLKTRSWEQDGVRKYITEVVAWQLVTAEKEATGAEVSDAIDIPF